MLRTASVDGSVTCSGQRVWMAVLRVADVECGRQKAESHIAWRSGELNVWSAVSCRRQQNLANCG